MELEIGEWKIRSWTPGDEAALVKHANNRSVWINLRDSFPHPYTEADAKAWLHSVKKQKKETAFAIASSVEAIGAIGLHLNHDVYRRSAEIGFWLGEPFWGKGIATRAVRAFTEYAFGAFDLVRIDAHVFAWNTVSPRVLEKSGYSFEGCFRKSVTKDGKTCDQLVYAIIRDDV